jgi:hypothetical protein
MLAGEGGNETRKRMCVAKEAEEEMWQNQEQSTQAVPAL